MNDYTKNIVHATWYPQGKEFLLEWLKEVKIELGKQKSKRRRGMPYKRTLKRWGKWWGEDDLADIVRIAHKVMNNIIVAHPEVKAWL